MSEERAIRINKVLRELNISLDRAVDFLKDKGHTIEASPNAKISGAEYNALYNQFSADKGNKVASQEVSEEKRKEKEALRIEREKELEEKRKQDEEKQRQEVIRARASIQGPVSVGKIDLNANRKAEPTSDAPVKQEPKAEKPQPVKVEEPKQETPQPVAEQPKAAEAPQAEVTVKEEKQPVQEPVAPTVKAQPEKPAAAKPAITPAVESTPTTPAAPATTETPATQAPVAADGTDDAATGTPEEETIKTQYTKLSGTTFTGQTIDLSQFNKPKKKKEEPKANTPRPGGAANNNAANDKNKRKRITPNPNGPNAPAKPPQGQQGAAVHIKTPGGAGLIRPNTAGQATTGGNRFGPNKRPAIVSKVEPTEEEVKNQIRETLEKLQGKGGKSKAAKYRRDKRDTHRQRTDDEQRALDEGSKTIKVTEFVTVGEVATMMDVPITK